MTQTNGSNYVWWFFFTGSVISGFVITLCLDGFFGSSKGEETLAYGVRGCAPGLMRGLGFHVSGESQIGLPRLDYIEDMRYYDDVVQGESHSEEDRRSRRGAPGGVGNGAELTVGSRVYGSNFTGSGPVPADMGCYQLLQDYAEFLDDNTDATDRLQWWENADNKPFETMLCISASKLRGIG
jgi:hypothetical protein